MQEILLISKDLSFSSILSRVQVFQHILCQVRVPEARIFSDSHSRPFQGLNHKEITLMRAHSVGLSSLRSRFTPAHREQLARGPGGPAK